MSIVPRYSAIRETSKFSGTFKKISVQNLIVEFASSCREQQIRIAESIQGNKFLSDDVIGSFKRYIYVKGHMESHNATRVPISVEVFYMQADRLANDGTACHLDRAGFPVHARHIVGHDQSGFSLWR